MLLILQRVVKIKSNVSTYIETAVYVSFLMHYTSLFIAWFSLQRATLVMYSYMPPLDCVNSVDLES